VLTISKDFKHALKTMKMSFEHLKMSLDPYGYTNLFGLSVYLPFNCARLGMDWFTGKVTFVWSNVNGSKK